MHLSSSRGILVTSQYTAVIQIYLKSGVKHDIEVPFELSHKRSQLDAAGEGCETTDRLESIQESLKEKYSFFEPIEMPGSHFSS